MMICYFFIIILMNKLGDRLNKSSLKRRYRFVTDLDSKSESSGPSEAISHQENNNNKTKGRAESRSISKFKELLRRNYKFLTETEYSDSLNSESFEEEEMSRKRERSPNSQDNNEPKKKLKLNEE